MPRWTEAQARGFADAAQSLKLYRRAELIDDDSRRSLIDQLYVDPLPNNGIFTAMMRPNTTFLIGRKGTGKSTVFQRAQHEIRKERKAISSYLDIKTIFESSEVDSTLLDKIGRADAAMPPAMVQQLLLYEAFVKAVLVEIRLELRKQIDDSLLSRLKERILPSSGEMFEALDDLIDSAKEAMYADITGLRSVDTKTERQRASTTDDKGTIKALGGTKVGVPHVEVSAEIAHADGARSADNEDQAFSKILLRTFNIKEIITQLGALLSQIGIGRLWIAPTNWWASAARSWKKRDFSTDSWNETAANFG
jgi:hypothetical protein